PVDSDPDHPRGGHQGSEPAADQLPAPADRLLRRQPARLSAALSRAEHGELRGQSGADPALHRGHLRPVLPDGSVRGHGAPEHGAPAARGDHVHAAQAGQRRERAPRARQRRGARGPDRDAAVQRSFRGNQGAQRQDRGSAKADLRAGRIAPDQGLNRGSRRYAARRCGRPTLSTLHSTGRSTCRAAPDRRTPVAPARARIAQQGAVVRPWKPGACAYTHWTKPQREAGAMRENTEVRWGSVQIGLHWTIAALVLLVQVPAGLTMTAVDPGTVQDVCYNIHKTNGIVIFLLAIVRLGWRWRHPVPYLPSDMPAWQVRTARTTHAILYIVLFAMPITGLLYTAMGGFPVPVCMLYDLAQLVPENKPVAEGFKYAHLTLQYVLYLTVALHVAGALQHHLVRKDGILRRMLSSETPLPELPR